MQREIDKYISVLQPHRRDFRRGPIEWHTAPNGEKLPLLDRSEVGVLDREDQPAGKHVLFLAPFLDGIEKGDRVRYLGQHFVVKEVTRSRNLRGMELRCESLAELSNRLIAALR